MSKDYLRLSQQWQWHLSRLKKNSVEVYFNKQVEKSSFTLPDNFAGNAAHYGKEQTCVCGWRSVWEKRCQARY